MAIFGSGPVEVDSPEKMLDILKELAGDNASNWRGMIDVWYVEGEGNRWRLEMNDDDGHTVTAHIGDYLVLSYGHLLRLDPSQV